MFINQLGLGITNLPSMQHFPVPLSLLNLSTVYTLVGENMADDQEHRDFFTEQFLNRVKVNNRVISREDLNSVKEYLMSKRPGTKKNPNIQASLLRRINRNSWDLVNFGEAVDVVCTVSQNSAISSGRKASCYHFIYVEQGRVESL